MLSPLEVNLALEKVELFLILLAEFQSSTARNIDLVEADKRSFQVSFAMFTHKGSSNVYGRLIRVHLTPNAREIHVKVR
jgi:hypothetical protein